MAVVYFDVLSRHSSGETEVNWKNPQQRLPVVPTGFEMGTFRLQVHNRGRFFGRSSNSITPHNCYVAATLAPLLQIDPKGGE
jgi:hypothetical protein